MWFIHASVIELYKSDCQSTEALSCPLFLMMMIIDQILDHPVWVQTQRSSYRVVLEMGDLPIKTKFVQNT